MALDEDGDGFHAWSDGDVDQPGWILVEELPEPILVVEKRQVRIARVRQPKAREIADRVYSAYGIRNHRNTGRKRRDPNSLTPRMWVVSPGNPSIPSIRAALI